MSLLGKRCIISGGSRGIGLAIARLFAAEGATCTLIGRNQEALSTAAESLPRHNSQDHETVPFDVSNTNYWMKMVADRKTVKCDILVNAAGISQNSFLFNTAHGDVSKIINTNLTGTIWGCKFLVPKMMKQKEGCIINVSSLMAIHGGRGASIYAASKAGIVGLTRSLAWEVGRFGIRANVLLPGYIQTEMTEGMDKNGELSTLIPMGRLGLVDEVADAALFLAKNSYAHNCVLNIDGGLSAT
ncbi:NAD(P)-binding protein [Hypoxylon trugodes]|uniref:NAD(P)-binding protein n=1 Tax=Hypoxylon trugodes TaxID=326681 RepID=UPI00218F32F5|nr:NAD(P)-binding protein [Hypoxylon trugodes]KAI1389055.1 NAD(P)-binding protein [Hypoxylon trugodes]